MGFCNKYNYFELRKRISYYSEALFIWVNRLFMPRGHIIMFHHVTDTILDVDSSCICSKRDFRDIIDTYINKGFHFIGLDEMRSFKSDINNKFVVVTFDDGCHDAFQNAFPFLRNNNIPFVVYIVTDFIDKPDYISSEELRILSQDPLCTIGYHTKSHLALIDTNNYQEELEEGKSLLEKMIGKELRYFAYPYGKMYMVGIKAIFKISKMGYINAVGTIDCPITRFSMLFNYYLPRMVVKI